MWEMPIKQGMNLNEKKSFHLPSRRNVGAGRRHQLEPQRDYTCSTYINTHNTCSTYIVVYVNIHSIQGIDVNTNNV